MHLAHLDGAAAAEILVVLAEAAMTAGDLDEAQHLCDEAGSHDRSHVDLQPLVRRLAHAREAARRPLEAAIDRALAENNLENAKRLAGQLLARFPESAVARRAVRAVREQGAAAA